MINHEYRELNVSDLKEYRRLRLELLKTEDQSFGSSYQEESNFKREMWLNRLSKSTSISYGAYEGDTLLGIIVGVLNPREKMKHVATINSVYVTPNKRHRGIGKQLVIDMVAILKNKEIEIVKLSVVTTNTKALDLYKSIGFKVYGLEEGFIRINTLYIDQYLLRMDI